MQSHHHKYFDKQMQPLPWHDSQDRSFAQDRPPPPTALLASWGGGAGGAEKGQDARLPSPRSLDTGNCCVHIGWLSSCNWKVQIPRDLVSRSVDCNLAYLQIVAPPPG